MNENLPSADLSPRTVNHSLSEMAEIVMPNDTNPLGNLLGGRLMHWVDLSGAMAAHRHSGNPVVTASINKVDFLVPVHVGDVVILKSSINRAFHTSLEAGVKVFVENYRTGEWSHVASAYVTFVAIDAEGHKIRVPEVVPETAEQQRRFEDAARRRHIRSQEKKLQHERRAMVAQENSPE